MSAQRTVSLPSAQAVTRPTTKAPEWSGGKLEAWMTRKGPGGKRVIQGRKKMKAKSMFFKWPHAWSHNLYYIDPEGIFIYGKRPILLYDTAYAEPLSPTNPKLVHKPIEVQLEAHGSAWLDLVVTERSFAHLFRAASDEKQKFNIMWIIMIALGFAMGWMGCSILNVVRP